MTGHVDNLLKEIKFTKDERFPLTLVSTTRLNDVAKDAFFQKLEDAGLDCNAATGIDREIEGFADRGKSQQACFVGKDGRIVMDAIFADQAIQLGVLSRGDIQIGIQLQ